MTGTQIILFAVMAITALAVLRLVTFPDLTQSRAGKITAFLSLLILPAISMTLATTEHIERSKTTEFCLSCHVMEPYGKSLRVDDSNALPAAHFQNRRIPRDEACFTCHSDYVMFGGMLAKLRGLRHVYVQWFGDAKQPLHLYKPFNNRECLHCHAGARSFEEGATHTADPDLLPAIKSNQKSCLSSGCHDTVHNIAGLKDAKFWKESK